MSKIEAEPSGAGTTPLVKPLNYMRLLAFFFPLGLSASLVTLSHVIINSTLARSSTPEITISGYALALSIFTLSERPAVMLRQTCSALVQDRISFAVMTKLTLILIAATTSFGFIIGFTPVGSMLFQNIFHPSYPLLQSGIEAYRVLMFVTVFSAIRSLYQGILIRNFHTKWLTLGMIVRLAVMYVSSLFFLHGQKEITSSNGAIIFLLGMAVEAMVSFVEGRRVVRSTPKKVSSCHVMRIKDTFPFYRPLVVSSFLAVIVAPSIHSGLGHTIRMELAIASFALALSMTQLITTFFSYVHQLVLNFYRDDPVFVRKFCTIINFIPSGMMMVICFTSLGPWILSSVMGVSDDLLRESMSVMRIFIIFTLVFPWIDYCNGLVMLGRKTRIMIYSQGVNVIITIAVLLVMLIVVPEWNGRIGAAAQSAGMIGELIMLGCLVKWIHK